MTRSPHANTAEVACGLSMDAYNCICGAEDASKHPFFAPEDVGAHAGGKELRMRQPSSARVQWRTESPRQTPEHKDSITMRKVMYLVKLKAKPP